MKELICFLLGAGIGAGATYLIIKEKYKKLADEEIASVRDTFKERLSKIEATLNDEQKAKIDIVHKIPGPTPDDPVDIKIQIDEDNKKNLVEKLGYSVGVDLSEDESQSVDNVIKIDTHDAHAPYILSEEEFGEFGNDEETLILYADGVLATEEDELVDDVEALLGNCLEAFEDDEETLYVRNQDREVDYTILRSEKMFKDIMPEGDE